MKIELPYNFSVREYQKGFCAATFVYRLILSVWHRRSGKDYCHISMLVPKMMERIGTYFYIFPTAKQGRKIIWDGIDGNGKKFLNHIPEILIKNKNNVEMKIELINGSIFQVIGSDNYNDTLIGTNPVGVIFSEYSLQKPEVWHYVEPILTENKGFAWFNFTPRGKNFAYTIYQTMLKEKDCYVSLLTIEDTGVISLEDIDSLRRKGTPESIIQQEYYCSFMAFNEHIIYSAEMEMAYKQKRIGPYVYDPSYPLYTSWDLGVNDSMTIVFFQLVANRIMVIDYYENSGRAMKWYKNEILDPFKEDKGYKYDEHFAPHDIKQRDMMVEDESGFAMTRIEGAAKFGLDFTQVIRVQNVWDRINDTKELFYRIYINQDLTTLLNALSSYQKRKNETLSTPLKFVYDPKPLHDWASNAADAFGGMAQAIKQGLCTNKAVCIADIERTMNIMNNHRREYRPI